MIFKENMIKNQNLVNLLTFKTYFLYFFLEEIKNLNKIKKVIDLQLLNKLLFNSINIFKNKIK